MSLIAVWLVGPSRSGTATRRGLAPFLARWEIAYGGAAALLFLLVLWGPTVQVTRARFVITVAILLALGSSYCAARRLARFRVPLRSIWATRRAPFSSESEAPPPDARLDQLEQLARLREQGVLSDEELAAEKQRLLGTAG